MPNFCIFSVFVMREERKLDGWNVRVEMRRNLIEVLGSSEYQARGLQPQMHTDDVSSDVVSVGATPQSTCKQAEAKEPQLRLQIPREKEAQLVALHFVGPSKLRKLPKHIGVFRDMS